MYKFFNKKLNKKGFTLAELLVVIAILAILIAIAIPVFSNMVADANLRVNQANLHSTKSAAVTMILTHLDEKDPKNQVYNLGLVKKTDTNRDKGWVANAKVDNSGNITDLKVYVVTSSLSTRFFDGISTVDLGNNPCSSTTETDTFFLMPKTVDTTCKFATVKPTTGNNGTATYYTTQVVITDLDLEKANDPS